MAVHFEMTEEPETGVTPKTIRLDAEVAQTEYVQPNHGVDTDSEILLQKA
jgi:hypothetical protein